MHLFIYLFIYLVATIRRRTNGKKEETSMSALKGPMDSMDARYRPVKIGRGSGRQWRPLTSWHHTQYKRRMTIFVSPHTAPPDDKQKCKSRSVIDLFFCLFSFIYKQKCVTPKEYYSARG